MDRSKQENHIIGVCIYPFTNWEPVSGNTPLGSSLGPQMGLRFIVHMIFEFQVRKIMQI